MMNAYSLYALVFMAYTPGFRCKIQLGKSNLKNIPDLNFSIIADQCELRYVDTRTNETLLTEKCFEWDYDTDIFESTLITQFNLVCDHAIYSKNMLSIVAAAGVLGCLMFGWVQDHWGRRIAFEINVVTYVTGGIISLFMPSFFSFTAVDSSPSGRAF